MVIPVLDEARHLPDLLADLDAQDLPASEFDVLVLDGGSTDGTLDFLEGHRPSSGYGFQVLNNPERTVPHARNLALAHLADDVGLLVAPPLLSRPESAGIVGPASGMLLAVVTVLLGGELCGLDILRGRFEGEVVYRVIIVVYMKGEF